MPFLPQNWEDKSSKRDSGGSRDRVVRKSIWWIRCSEEKDAPKIQGAQSENQDFFSIVYMRWSMPGTFTERLKTAMEKEGIGTYRELAERIGVDPNTVTNWITKGGIARGSSRLAVANVLRVNIDWLHTGEGRMSLGPDANRKLYELGKNKGQIVSKASVEAAMANEEVTFNNIDPVLREDTLAMMRWMFTQKDQTLLLRLPIKQIAQEMKSRPPVDVDAFHRNWLKFRIYSILKGREQELPDAKKEAILAAAWSEGGGMGYSPEDTQLNRYIDVALA